MSRVRRGRMWVDEGEARQSGLAVHWPLSVAGDLHKGYFPKPDDGRQAWTKGGAAEPNGHDVEPRQ